MVAFDTLRLSGFKSFVEATDIRILPGLTGIVGPNGCGKSNLVEALRWVMGESSAKRLRGGEMDDVIFSGTAGRPARNQAEVTLRLDNSDLDAPPLFNNARVLEVTRRVVRGQGSAYRVNGRDHRAQDLKLLFADLASGAASNAMVAQGRVTAIVNARPIDRRALLEEAAGITGLYARRREAENRLRACEQNLERVGDLQAAKQSQRRSLDRQAGAARRYTTLQDQRRATAAILTYLEWQAVEEALARANAALAKTDQRCRQLEHAAHKAQREEEAANQALAPLRIAQVEAAAAVQRLDLALEALANEAQGLTQRKASLTRQLAECGDDLAREQEHVAAAAQRLATLEAEEKQGQAQRLASKPDIARQTRSLEEAEAAERAAAKALRDQAAELSTARNAHLALKAQQKTLTERHSALQKRLEKVRASGDSDGPDAAVIDAKIAAQSAAQAQLAKLQTTRAQARDALTDAQTARAQTRNELENAHQACARLEAEAEGLAALLTPTQAEDAAETLAQKLEVAEDFGPQVAAALGDALAAHLAADGEAAATTDHWRQHPIPPAPPLPAGLPSLAQALIHPAWLKPILAYVGVARDSQQAEQHQAQLHPGQALTTAKGGLWRWDGYTAAQDRSAGQASLIARAQRLRALEAQRPALKTAAETAALTAQRAEELVEQCQRDLQDCEEAVHQAQAGLNTLGRDIAQAQRALADHRARVATQEAEQAATTRELETVTAELEALNQAETSDATLDLLQQEVVQAQRRHDQAHAKVRDGRATLEAAKRDLITLEARLGAILTETFTFEGQHKNAAAQLEVLQTRARGLEAEAVALAARPQELNAQREAVAASRAEAAQTQATAGDRLAEAETQSRQLRAAAQSTANAFASAREARARHEAEQSAAQDSAAATARRAYETFKRPAADLLELAALNKDQGKKQGKDQALPSREQAQTLLQRLDRQIDQIGPVNLTAEAELKDLEAELAQLDQEVSELTKAIAKLRRAIGELNQEGRARLQAAFAQVATHFSSLFACLFNGGKAHLELVGADDPLEAGLEIYASPPGKRLQSLTLLSGGEQTLTALALIFAMFRTNPAPLCVLDEVDAPLDDANVERLHSLLEDIAKEVGTRFLIVTHNALTMARVDRLYGVTMTEQGVSRLVSVSLAEAEPSQAH